MYLPEPPQTFNDGSQSHDDDAPSSRVIEIRKTSTTSVDQTTFVKVFDFLSATSLLFYGILGNRITVLLR